MVRAAVEVLSHGRDFHLLLCDSLAVHLVHRHISTVLLPTTVLPYHYNILTKLYTLTDGVLLALSGPITAIPLIAFSYATKRVSLATIGLVQYLNPTLQFLVATLIFQEEFTFWHAVAFAMIWTALAIYSAAAWRQDKAARRAPTRP